MSLLSEIIINLHNKGDSRNVETLPTFLIKPPRLHTRLSKFARRIATKRVDIRNRSISATEPPLSTSKILNKLVSEETTAPCYY